MEHRKPASPAPAIAFGVTWVLYSLIFPTYRLWHFLVCLGVSLVVSLIARLVTAPDAPAKTDPPAEPTELERLTRTCDAQLEQLRTLNAKLPDPDVTARLDEIIRLTGQIRDKLSQSPDKSRQTRRFLEYFLPTTIQLLTRRLELEQSGVDTENVTRARGRIDEMLSGVETACRRQLDDMYENDLVDITAEIKVMQQLMAAEGLSE